MEEAQAGIKIAGRIINNLRYAYDATLIAESKEELNSLLMKVKEESEKAGLKLSIQKKQILKMGFKKAVSQSRLQIFLMKPKTFYVPYFFNSLQ